MQSLREKRWKLVSNDAFDIYNIYRRLYGWVSTLSSAELRWGVIRFPLCEVSAGPETERSIYFLPPTFTPALTFSAHSLRKKNPLSLCGGERGVNTCYPAIRTSVSLTFFKKEYLLHFSTFSSHICLLTYLFVPVSFNFSCFPSPRFFF